jgi:hypothetical protein
MSLATLSILTTVAILLGRDQFLVSKPPAHLVNQDLHSLVVSHLAGAARGRPGLGEIPPKAPWDLDSNGREVFDELDAQRLLTLR